MYDEDLTNLEEWIRRLKIDYEIFFNGNRKKPPDDLRLRVERLVKRLAESTDMSFSQRFPLQHADFALLRVSGSVAAQPAGPGISRAAPQGSGVFRENFIPRGAKRPPVSKGGDLDRRPRNRRREGAAIVR